jgi:hypothetical protein
MSLLELKGKRAYLSGRNSYALTQIHPKTSGSVDDAP